MLVAEWLACIATILSLYRDHNLVKIREQSLSILGNWAEDFWQKHSSFPHGFVGINVKASFFGTQTVFFEQFRVKSSMKEELKAIGK